MASLEAILYDVPVIVSRESGVAEILKDAVKVDARDVDQLADAILSMLTDRTLRDATVRACSQAITGVCWVCGRLRSAWITSNPFSFGISKSVKISR